MNLIRLTICRQNCNLAGSLYDCFGDKASKEILEQGMLSDNIYVNKETMQILLNIDLKKRHKICCQQCINI